MSSDDLCSLCGNDRQWHVDNQAIHMFAGPGQGLVRKPPAMEVRVSSLPFDPVLRLALIDAGVLTLEQLQAAEDKIHATNPGTARGDVPDRA